MSKWILQPKKLENPQLRLFCLPYAGSSALVTYRYLSDKVPAGVEVCPIELPGRGSRLSEPLIDDFTELVEKITSEIQNYIDIPYVILGHSMGAILGYELTKNIILRSLKNPIRIYLSAHRAPHMNERHFLMHELSEESFKQELIKMNGISKEIMEHDELLNLVLPIIRNDYKVCETYQSNSESLSEISTPMVIFGGKQDIEISTESLNAWGDLTSADIEMNIIEGDHFFITKEKDQFAGELNKYLVQDLFNLTKN